MLLSTEPAACGCWTRFPMWGANCACGLLNGACGVLQLGTRRPPALAQPRRSHTDAERFLLIYQGGKRKREDDANYEPSARTSTTEEHQHLVLVLGS